MKARVTERGVTVPRHMLKDADEVEIRQENGRVVIEPVAAGTEAEGDALLELGQNPIPCGASGASERHDRYLYGRDQ